MNALLVYPEFPDTYWSFRHALRFENKRSALPPLGLLTISAMLPDAWDRRLVDLNVRPLNAADIEWADLVMVSAMLVLLLPELTAWSEARRRPFYFITEASVNLAEDDELLDGMRRAGFRRVFLGIETPVEESLKETLKHQNTRHDLLDSVRKIQSHGMEVTAGFIVGFDNDPEDIFERQIRFIRESAIPLAFVNLLTALPDTQLWRRLEREGRLPQESTGINTDCLLNFIPKMDAARLVEGYKTILRTIYSPSEYYQRALDCLGRLGQMIQDTPPVQRRRSFAQDFMSLARILFTLGVRDHARRDFWRYLRKACAAHRERFEDAILLAACGYHLRKLTEANCN